MSSRASWTKPLFVLLLLLAPLSTGWAQSKQDGCLKDTVCRDSYYKALKLYDEGKYVEALDGFQSAYGRRQMPWLLLNIGRTLQRLGRAQEAINYYERYKKAELNIDAATLDKVNKYIEQAKALLDTSSPEPQPNQTQPTTPTTGTVEPAPGSDPGKSSTATSPGSTQPLPAAALTGGPATDSASTPVYKKWWFWTIVGVVVVGGVAAGVGVAVANRATPAEPFLPTDPIFSPTF